MGIKAVYPDGQSILDDPAASYWLKNAVNTALDRDPVDAVNDAEVLLEVLKRHLNAVFQGRA